MSICNKEVEIKSKDLNNYDLNNMLSSSSQMEIPIPTQKDMNIREYIKSYKESKINDFLPSSDIKENSELSNFTHYEIYKQEINASRPSMSNTSSRYSNFSNGIMLNSSSSAPFETPNKSMTGRADSKDPERRHKFNLNTEISKNKLLK